MGKSKSPLGNLEIKKTPQGFLIEKNGDALEIRDTETFVLLKALVNAIHERDFEFITNLLPGSFLSEKIYYDAGKKIRDKRIIFISDFPEFRSKFNAILESSHIIQPEYLQYDDKNIFSRDMDLIVAFHRLPHKKFFLQLNRFCLDHNVQFIKAMIDNFKFIVTPFLLPYESACYNCYCLLKTRNGIFDRDTLESQDFIHISDSPPPDFMLHFCAGFMVVMLVKFLTMGRFLQEDLSEIVLDFTRIEISKNPLLKVPFCDACNLRSKKQ
jgi:hypothetical protein